MDLHVVPDREIDLPISCITRDAKTIKTCALVSMQVGRKERLFLDYLIDETFGNAKRHRNAGHTEDWCFFSLESWIEKLSMSKQQVANIRKALIDRHVIWYECHPGAISRIGWNLTTDEWQMTTYGGKRAGAGYRKDESRCESTYDTTNHVVSPLPLRRVRMPAKTPITSCTNACYKPSTEQEPEDSLIQVTNDPHGSLAKTGTRTREKKATPPTDAQQKLYTRIHQNERVYEETLELSKVIQEYNTLAHVPQDNTPLFLKWVKEMSLLLESDYVAKYTIAQMLEKSREIRLWLIVGADGTSEFSWQNVILSASSFRKNFPKMYPQYIAKHRKEDTRHDSSYQQKNTPNPTKSQKTTIPKAYDSNSYGRSRQQATLPDLPR